MSILEGQRVDISTPALRKIIGKKIGYLRECDIDRSGRGYIFPRVGVIVSVYKKNIELDSGEFIAFSQMNSIVLKEGVK